ncbi:hypothetical protein [Anabaena subtropica]|uniref:Uncharacterized protein n=1 Tax=Anabaena subtropica FACHB-260 TaxID=2692884 RepID=A0ABR8CN46_9NOST|nr:hypothetical protein [Anabaena subtropica]MBD2343784.1 hypothetical protein [Anabaena subtropica FACHB-260]
MQSRLNTPNKKLQKETSAFSTNPNQGMFESRSFVVQSKESMSNQPDLKTSLMQAKKYGHNLGQIVFTNVSNPEVIQQKCAREIPENKTSSIEPIQAANPDKRKNRRIDYPTWSLDQMAEKAHNENRTPKYARHSTTAVGIPITHTGFGVPTISQQRGNNKTVNDLKEQFSERGLQEPQIVTNLDSGQHADPFAVYNAFAGDFENTDDLALSVLLGVSKGRCNDCNDAISDFPIVMDKDYTLGKSTKKWKHGRRED